MGQMGIWGQPGCGLSFRLNFLFGKIRVKLGLEDQNFAKGVRASRLAMNIKTGIFGRPTISRAIWTRHFLQYARRARARISSSWHALLIMFPTVAAAVLLPCKI